MNSANRRSCSRCGLEVSSTDKFCQECGLSLPFNVTPPPPQTFTGANQQIYELLDFSPPAPEKVKNEVEPRSHPESKRLHSPLLDSQVIDCTPPAPGFLGRRGQRTGAALTDFLDKDERAQLRSNWKQTTDQTPAATGTDRQTTVSLSSTAVAAAAPPTEPSFYNRSPGFYDKQPIKRSDNFEKPSFLPGPLLDLLRCSLVLVTLTAIAFCVGTRIFKSHQEAQLAATNQVGLLLKQGKFKEAHAKLATLSQVVGSLNKNQTQMLNECRFQQAGIALEQGSVAEARSLLMQVDTSSPRFARSRELLVLLNTKVVPQEEASPPKPVVPRRTRKYLSDKQNLELPEIPEVESAASESPKPPEAGTQASDGDGNAPAPQAPADETPQAAKEEEKRVSKPPRCSERDIAAYNRMLALWLSHNKMSKDTSAKATEGSLAPEGTIQSKSDEPPAGVGTPSPDPPSFREWLQQGKQKF